MLRFAPLMLGLSACMSFAQPRPYEPLRVQTGAAAETAAAATRSALAAAGYRLAGVAQGVLTAVSVPSRGMRDHVVIAIGNGGELSVDVRTEIASDGAWLSADRTCAGYSYMREKKLLAMILDKVHTQAEEQLQSSIE
jgi:hypothetical protein